MNMNIELNEVISEDVFDEALELAAGGAQGAILTYNCGFNSFVYSC